MPCTTAAIDALLTERGRRDTARPFNGRWRMRQRGWRDVMRGWSAEQKIEDPLRLGKVRRRSAGND